jgi:hypothetical protein
VEKSVCGRGRIFEAKGSTFERWAVSIVVLIYLFQDCTSNNVPETAVISNANGLPSTVVTWQPQPFLGDRPEFPARNNGISSKE